MKNLYGTTVPEKQTKKVNSLVDRASQQNAWYGCSYTNKIEPHLAAALPLLQPSLCMQGDIIMEVHHEKRTNAQSRKRQTLSQQLWKYCRFMSL